MTTITLATAPRTDSKRWPAREVTWDELVAWLDLPNPADVKEAGGYVLAKLRGGRRTKGSVESRSPVLVLDADSALPTLPDELDAIGYAAWWHTTWSHGEKGCRYRVGVLASREMTPDEYERAALALMHRLGADQFDRTSAQASRFMYRPATQDPDVYAFGVVTGEPVDVDELLAEYAEQAARTPVDAANTADPGAGVTQAASAPQSAPEDVVRHRIDRALRDLDDLAVLPEGGRLDWPSEREGVGWDRGAYYIAQRLVEAANSSTSYTLDDAREDFMKHAPAADGTYDPEYKWDSAVRAVGARGVPYESAADVFGREAPGQVDARTSSWSGVDLTGYLDGTYQPPVPELLTRTDGVSLLYPGLIHSLHGESESGKSFVMQALAVQCMSGGKPVLYVDHESDPGSLVERLLLLGASREAIARWFTYVQPETDPDRTEADRAALYALLDARPYVLAVIDGVSESMSVVTGEQKDPNATAIEWTRKVPRRIADRTGAAVVQIDHVTKNADTRGRFAIGGQAKMASLTGAAYLVDVAAPLGRGLRGELVLRVAKDRPGYVRGRSGEHRPGDRTQEAARVVVDSTGDAPVVTILPPHVGPSPDDAQERVMRAICDYLAELPDDNLGATRNTVRRDVPGKNDTKDVALRALVERGNVSVTVKGQSRHHRLVRPYVPEFEEVADA